MPHLPYVLPFLLEKGPGFPYIFPQVFGSRPPEGTIAAALPKATAALSGHMQPSGTIGVTLKHATTNIVAGASVIPVEEPAKPSEIPPTELELLKEQLLYGDPITSADAAETLATLKTPIDSEWTVTVYDKMWRAIGQVGDDMIELSGTDPRNNLPTATLVLKGDSVYIGVMQDCKNTMVGVTVETAGMRYAYYVDTFDWEFADGAWTGTAHLNGIWDILNYLVIWPNFLFPIQVQIPSHAVFIWAVCTCIEAMVAECALRIQSGLWEFINNAFSLNPDIRAWFGTLLQSNGNIFDMLKCPIYIVPTNPFLDTSPLLAKTVRMESCGTVIRDVTKAYGVDVRVDLWLPGDEQPDPWTKNFAFMRLDQPTYVVTVKDRSQITGPTGTVLDSVLRTVVDLGGSFFGDVFPGIFRQVPGMEGVFYAPWLGVNYVPPWAIIVAPDPGDHKGSVISCKVSYHTPKGWQHIIGGRSPKWLNDFINATTAWAIDAISILLGFTGIPSSLLEGFLNNAFLAFQLWELYGRRNQVGPYHPGIEVFHATSSAPYNIETMFDFINAAWDSRGWISCVARFRNQDVLTLGRDVFRGGLVSVVYPAAASDTATGEQVIRRQLYTDYIENTAYHISQDLRDVILQIGDGKAKESPLAKHQRFLTGVLEAINVVTLAPQSAGLL